MDVPRGRTPGRDRRTGISERGVAFRRYGRLRPCARPRTQPANRSGRARLGTRQPHPNDLLNRRIHAGSHQHCRGAGHRPVHPRHRRLSDTRERACGRSRPARWAPTAVPDRTQGRRLRDHEGELGPHRIPGRRVARLPGMRDEPAPLARRMPGVREPAPGRHRWRTPRRCRVPLRRLRFAKCGSRHPYGRAADAPNATRPFPGAAGFTSRR